jgi:hypothetical protein
MNAYKYLEFRIHHFSFYFFLVRPVYFLLSFLERTVWSLHPSPPYQCPVLSIPLTNCFWQNVQMLPASCSRLQKPHSIVIPLSFSWTTTEFIIWQSSQLKHLPQQPYLYHLNDSFMCLHVPFPGSYVSVLTCGILTLGLKNLSPM